MIIERHPHFKRNYKKRIFHDNNLRKKTDERLRLFQQNPSSPLLGDHSLTGDMKGFRSFSITGDIRIVYYLKDDTVWLYDIGTHNQVY